jgi:radical SAM protein with 4Fe4S-binding SPASM domain
MSSNAKQVLSPYYTYGLLYLSPGFHEWERSKGPEFKRYRQAWVERALHLDAGEFPLNLNIEATTRCNLACTFCTHPSLTSEEKKDMPWELYARVIDEAERYTTPAANLNGLGEPMLMRNVAEMVRYAKQHGFSDVMFHTNGTIMPDAVARALIEAGLDRIIFSVDSPDKTTYEAMRVNARWDRVVDNVRQFVHVRNGLGRSIPVVRATMVLTERTLGHVDAFIDMWKPLVDQITLQDLVWRSKPLADGEWRNQETPAVPVDLDAVRDEAIRRDLSFACPYLYQSTYVHGNGNIVPCSNPRARKEMVMGQLDAVTTLHDVWHGAKYKQLRLLHEAGKWHEHPVCCSCEVPLVELYKALYEESSVADQPGADASLPVASDLGHKGAAAADLALQFLHEGGTLPE